MNSVPIVPTPRSLRFALALLVGPTLAFAALKIASPFADHMVLQQQQPIPVWGEADAGEKVIVNFAGRQSSTIASADGHWRVDLPALEASSEARAFTVKGIPR